MDKRTSMKIGLFCVLLGACSAVKIINLKVPSTYLLDQTSKTPDPLILDCEYEVDENEKGFVLKWLLDGQPVYQWIPSKNPFPFQSFKNRVDTSYVVSQEHLHKHRAMAIIKPLANFTGEYSCIVQTYASIDRRAAKLKIIVRESKFDLSYYSNGDGEVTVDCQARDISPLPELQIRINNELFETENLKSVQGENGLYNASISGTLRKDQLESPAQIECLLTIPETNYNKRRSTTYYDPDTPIAGPGNVTDTTELYATESNSATSLPKLTSFSIFVTIGLVSSRFFSR
uniref:Ig-like domain-containing protein n=1 Tax=Anopheles atroparvus TaxID=41427 RepID=A0AAG5DTJ1_ANOAO